MNKELLKFIQSDPSILKNLKISQYLGSKELFKYQEQKVKKAFEKHLAAQSFPFHDQIPLDYITGETVLGYYPQNPDMLIRSSFSSLSGHVVMAGATGTGKSNWTLILLHQIQKQYPDTNLRYLVFATKKNCEQRNLIINNSPGSAFFLDISTLALRPFSPIPNVAQPLVIAELARIIASEIGLMGGGQVYLQNMIDMFLKNDSEGSFLEFVRWISDKKEYSKDNQGYHDRLVIRLNAIMLEIGEIFKCHKGIADHTFIEENIIIELPCSSSFIMSVVSGIILGRMFRFKAANTDYLKFKNLIVLEDIQMGIRYE